VSAGGCSRLKCQPFLKRPAKFGISGPQTPPPPPEAISCVGSEEGVLKLVGCVLHCGAGGGVDERASASRV
jgi:hypothetical protein